MARTDLDERLRSAFALPSEPGASDAQRAAIARALPAYRARRRARVVGVGASALGALGLAIALVAITAHQTPKLTAAPAHRFSLAPGPDCVEVAIGGGPLACDGAPVPVSAAFSSANGPLLGPDKTAAGAAATGTTPSPLAVRHAAGSRIEVSLPKLAGVAWTSVVIVPSGANTGTVVATHVARASGRTVAVIGPERAGTYRVIASGAPTCTGKIACKGMAEEWSVALNVT